MQKYGFDEARPVLERASARETAARVALGAVAAAFLEQALGVALVSPRRRARRRVEAPPASSRAPDDVARLDADPVRCLDPDASAAMVAEIDAGAQGRRHARRRRRGASSYGLPPGLGSHVHWDRRLDSRLAGALMGIQAIKGVEVGDGFDAGRGAGLAGARRDRQTDADGVRADVGPLRRHRGRHVDRRAAAGARRDEADRDRPARAAHRRRRHRRGRVRTTSAPTCCAVPAAGIVAEAMVALVLADAVLEKFGGDSVAETRRNVEGYLATLGSA